MSSAGSASEGLPIDADPTTTTSGGEAAPLDDAGVGAEDPDAAGANARQITPRRVAVKFRPGTPQYQRNALHAQHHHPVERTIQQLDVDIVRVPPGQRAANVVARYRNHPRVEFAEAEVNRQPASTPNDPWYAGLEWYLETNHCNTVTGTCIPGMDAQRAWDITTGAANVAIAVIDSGIDYTHPEFQARYASGQIFGYNFRNGDPEHDHDIFDTYGHGTNVSGVIAAATNNSLGMAGTCWQNPLMVCRTAFGMDVEQAIIWAADHGARVISMSFGAFTSTSYGSAACQYAFDHGVALVGAAGNTSSSQPVYPAAYATVLAVTGVNADGQPLGFGYGNWIDLSAPGSGVVTTGLTQNDPGGDALGFAGGTSLAAPFVASAAALVLSVNPNLPPSQVMDILRNTADDLGTTGFDVYTGYGRVNFYRAVQAAQNAVPAQDTTPPTVTIIGPGNGAPLHATTTVSAQATDNVGVSRVDLYVDGSLVSGDTVPPHEWAFDTTTLPDGTHILTARAYDAAGNIGQSAPVSVTFDNAPPTVSFTTPASGATVTGTVTVQANAGDSAGVTSVSLSLDGASLGSDTSAPYSFTWITTTAPNGPHSLTVTARDAAANATSATISVTVSNTTGDTIAPSVSITSPAPGATVSGQVNVTVNAADNVAVTRVELWVDGVLKKTSTTAPFTNRWRTNTASNGAHTLQCKAYDAAGNMGVSAPVTVYK